MAVAPPLDHRPRARGCAWACASKALTTFGASLGCLRVRRMRSCPWTRSDRPVFLLISHRLGGGTERHLGDLVHALRNEGVRPIVVRPGLAGRLLWEERGDRRETAWCRESTIDPKSIVEMLDTIEPVHAHVHHSLGLPEALFDALADRLIPYDWTIHDYHAICPRINLIGSGGRYCGEPDEAACNDCLARLGDDSGQPVSESITAWRRKTPVGSRWPGACSCPMRMSAAGSAVISLV